MGRLIIFLAIAGIAYWYWSGQGDKSPESREDARLQANAALMHTCIRHEQRMDSAGALGGVADVGSSGQDAEKLCAQKNNLYLQDGEWHSRRD
jgi:hypothetical protein